MEPICPRLWMKCSLITSTKIQLSPGSILVALQASSGCTQVCVCVCALERLLPHYACSYPRISASSVLRFSRVGSVETTSTELWINSQQRKPNDILTQQLTMQETVCQTWWLSLSCNVAAGELKCGCLCVCERGVISRGFVTQLVLLMCYLIHLSLIWQALTIHPRIHLFSRPSARNHLSFSKSLFFFFFLNLSVFLSVYPGIQWIPDENDVVTFDCRNRNW